MDNCPICELTNLRVIKIVTPTPVGEHSILYPEIPATRCLNCNQIFIELDGLEMRDKAARVHLADPVIQRIKKGVKLKRGWESN